MRCYILVPLASLVHILRYAIARPIQGGEAELSIRLSLFRGFLEPFCALGCIFSHAVSDCLHLSKEKLRVWVTLDRDFCHHFSALAGSVGRPKSLPAPSNDDLGNNWQKSPTLLPPSESPQSRGFGKPCLRRECACRLDNILPATPTISLKCQAKP